MTNRRWLDMDRFIDLDPELVLGPADLAALRELTFAGADVSLLDEESWDTMVADATLPPDLRDAPQDGFAHSTVGADDQSRADHDDSPDGDDGEGDGDDRWHEDDEARPWDGHDEDDDGEDDDVDDDD